MTNIRPYQTGLTSLLTHIISIPLFGLAFILIYRSEWINHWMMLPEPKWHTLNILVLFMIQLVVLCGSRIPMTVCKIRMPWVYYILWTLGEVVVTSMLFALYMALMNRGSYMYFPCVGRCLMVVLGVSVIPYVIVNLVMATKKDEPGDAAPDSLVRFCDFTERLKLIIAADAILYIEADENYCKINYLEGERPREYSLRNSMTRIQPLMEKQGIVRCQRSYFVNPKHVKVLRRDKEGVIMAELDAKGVKDIPVSPKYYDNLNQKLL